MTDPEEIHTSVLLTIFTSKKKRYKVFYHQSKIIWDREKPPHKQKTVPIETVLAVKHIHKAPAHPLDDPTVDPNSFVIHYAKKDTKQHWGYRSVVFYHSDPIQVSSWVKTLQNHLQNLKGRPKKLLVFVNPYCGKRNCHKVYDKIAKPLFRIADVDATLIVTQRKDQIRDHVAHHGLDLYDGLVGVGGDGTLSELFNGLVMRECRIHNLNLDDINTELPKPSIPIGVIPGGSTDTITYCIHGSTDVSTSVMEIIFGKTLGLDLVTVYNENKLLRLYASVLSYGFLGDVAHDSDKFRWLGPRRYEYSGFKKVLGNQGYCGEIAILSERQQQDHPDYKCTESCQRCEVQKDQQKESEDKWETIKGKFFMVSIANISCACERSPKGLAPYSHLGDGNVHLVIVEHTSFVNNIRFLLRLSNRTRTLDGLPFVQLRRGREVCFRSVERKGKWNCDGEVEAQTDIRAKVRRQLITIYGRGPINAVTELEPGCCAFC